MDDRPLFSIILPTYNRADYLRDAIDSVLRQTVSDFELIVVDDGGDSVEVPDDDRIRVIRLPANRGPAAARNAGIEAAGGRFVTFLDDDDLFTEDRLELALTALEEAPIAVCWGRFIDESKGSGRRLSGDVSQSILDGPTPTLGCCAVRREMLVPFDERWEAVEDVVWWLHMSAKAHVATSPTVGYLVRRHDGPRNRNHLTARMDENQKFLEEFEWYFAERRRASAFRLKRIGLMAHSTGDRKAAMSAFTRSWLQRPLPTTSWHIVRTMVGLSRMPSEPGGP